MTLGTNANLEELIKYSPQEIDFDFILAELKELEEWRKLLNPLEYSVDDVKERINWYEAEAEKNGERIDTLECDIFDLEQEVERLKETIENLTASD